MTRRLRFGILGTGNIARQFAGGLASSAHCAVTAVGSRTAASAQAFAAAHAIPQSFGSYEDLLACRDIDAVYVSLPNSMHHAWTLRALDAGKHVLCEKPFASNIEQSREMFDRAARLGLLVMEAFMYRSHPLTLAIEQAVRAGQIGRVRLIRASFCFRVSRQAGNIRFDRDLAGGALMDVGCYCINFARMIAGAEPTTIHAAGQLHESGVDEVATGLMRFPGDLCATFTCGMSVQADNTASICGTDGYIEVPVPWKPPERGAAWVLGHSTPPRMDLPPGGAPMPPPRQTFTVDAGKALYALEADDFARAVWREIPPRVTPEDTLGNMRVLDEMRRQVHHA